MSWCVLQFAHGDGDGDGDGDGLHGDGDGEVAMGRGERGGEMENGDGDGDGIAGCWYTRPSTTADCVRSPSSNAGRICFSLAMAVATGVEERLGFEATGMEMEIKAMAMAMAMGVVGSRWRWWFGDKDAAPLVLQSFSVRFFAILSRFTDIEMVMEMAKQIHCIVFSKDRAFQLSECLRSFRLHDESDADHIRISVIYTSSTDALETSYRCVQKRYADVQFLSEVDSSGGKFHGDGDGDEDGDRNGDRDGDGDGDGDGGGNGNGHADGRDEIVGGKHLEGGPGSGGRRIGDGSRDGNYCDGDGNGDGDGDSGGDGDGEGNGDGDGDGFNVLEVGDFETSLRYLVHQHRDTDFTLFMVDDMLFYRRFKLCEFAAVLSANPHVFAVHLRLHASITFSHPANCRAKPPPLQRKPFPGPRETEHAATASYFEFMPFLGTSDWEYGHHP